jgi:hypothetical protein
MLCHSEKPAAFISYLYGADHRSLGILKTILNREKEVFFGANWTIRSYTEFAITIGMRHVAPTKLSEIAVPRWIGKRRLCIETERCVRTVDNWMAAGKLAFRKFPSGMIRFRLDWAERRFGIGGLPIKNTDNWVWVDHQVNQTELAEIHDISVDTVREWVERGIVPYLKNPGDRISFEPPAVESALSRFDVTACDSEMPIFPGVFP